MGIGRTIRTLRARQVSSGGREDDGQKACNAHRAGPTATRRGVPHFGTRSVKLCVLGSGSKGNAVLMQAGSTKVLIDAGFSTRAMSKRLGSIGVDPKSIEAVIITHEHEDHAKGAI